MSSLLTTGGIAALVVADVALVSLTVQHVRGDDGGASSGGDSETNEPAEPRGGDDRPGTESLDTVQVLLDAAPDGTLVRASRGECGGDTVASTAQPVVEVSTDGGQSFAPADLGAPAADALRVSTTGARAMFVVTADPTCALVGYRSDDGGATWSASAGTGARWHLAPAGGTRVHAPGGTVSAGCEVQALSAYSPTGARVLCTDGQLRGTASSGRVWVGLGSLNGAVDIAYETPADAWALAATPDCPASVLQTADGGADWTETACVDDAGGDPRAMGAAAGLVAVQVGEELLTSTDDGATFTRP